MSAPAPDTPARRSRRRTATTRRSEAHDSAADQNDAQTVELRTDTDVRAYADRLSELLRRTREEGAASLSVPAPEALAARQVGGSPDSTVTHAITDGALAEAVGSAWSSAKLRAELGNVTRQALNQRVQRGTLLGLPTSDGATVYPIFQFVRRGGKVDVRPGLRGMLKALHGQDPWTVAVALRTPAPELDGATPVDWEKRGGDESVLEELAEVMLREWAGPLDGSASASGGAPSDEEV